jgi:hypothetical protein
MNRPIICYSSMRPLISTFIEIFPNGLGPFIFGGVIGIGKVSSY